MPPGPLVILTQEAEDNVLLAQQLAALQALVRQYPCISTRYLPFDSKQPVNGRLVADYAVLAFTSKRGVVGAQAIRGQLASGQPAIACVGPVTAREAEARLGVKCGIMPASDQTAAGLAQAIVTAIKAPACVLHFHGDAVSGSFKEILTRQGWEVGELEVYVNGAPELTPIVLEGRAVAVFASPSAAQRFFAVNAGLHEAVTCVAIGAVTMQRLRELGLRRIVTANQPDSDGLLEAILEAIREEVNCA